MSQSSKVHARYVSDDLGNMENTLRGIEANVEAVKDLELTKKFSDVKSSVKAVRAYLSDRLGGAKSGQ